MTTRRSLIFGAAAVAATLGRARAEAPVLTDDGIYRHCFDWRRASEREMRQ